MRKSVVLLTIAAAVTSCNSVSTSLDDFDITRTASTTIQGSVLSQLLQPLGFAGWTDMNLSSSAEMKNQGVKPNQIDSVKLKLLRLKVSKPTSQDLTFFKSVKFYAESKDLPKLLVAHGGPFAAGQGSVDLTLDDGELKPYVTAAAMSLTSEVDGHSPAQDTTIDATVTLRVDVNVTGTITGK